MKDYPGTAGPRIFYGTIHLGRRHILGGGVKNLPNLPMDLKKTCQGRGQKVVKKFSHNPSLTDQTVSILLCTRFQLVIHTQLAT